VKDVAGGGYVSETVFVDGSRLQEEIEPVQDLTDPLGGKRPDPLDQLVLIDGEDLRDVYDAPSREVGLSLVKKDVPRYFGPPEIGGKSANDYCGKLTPIDGIILEDHIRAEVAGP
jgi:hypothetical protein